MFGLVLEDLGLRVFPFLIPIVGSVALFTFLSIASFAEERRKEREAYYRYEFERRIVEQHGIEALDRLSARKREEEELAHRRSVYGSRSGALILMGVGAGMLVGLRWISDGVSEVGWIPLAIGVAMLLYATVFAPRDYPPAGPGPPPR
jgi:hypothetical protein